MRWKGDLEVRRRNIITATDRMKRYRTWMPSPYAVIPFFAYNSLFAYHIAAQVQRHSTPIYAPCILPTRQASNLSFLIAGQALSHRPCCRRLRNSEEAGPVVYPPFRRGALFVSSRRKCCVIHTSEQRCIDDVLGLQSEDGRISGADVGRFHFRVSSFHGYFSIGSLRKFCLATRVS